MTSIWLIAVLIYSSIGLPVILFVAALLAMAFIALRHTKVTKWLILLALILEAGPPLFLIGLNINNNVQNTNTHRFRITVSVETPQGIKSGSSVIQVSNTKKFVHWNHDTSSSITRAKGEAIYLDLGNGKNIVITLAFGPTCADVDSITRLAAMGFGRYKAGFLDEAPSWEGRTELLGNLIPTLLTFLNPADPATARVVRPDEFESVFGPGYRLKSVWLEMTKDDWTQGVIERPLPWLKNYRDLHKLNLYETYGNNLHFHSALFIRRL